MEIEIIVSQIFFLISIVLANSQVNLKNKISDSHAKEKWFHHHKHKPPPAKTERSTDDLIRLGGKCYYLSTINGNFDDATSYCLTNNMRLASLPTKADNDIVAKYVNSLGLPVSTTRIRTSGHRDSCDPNTFIWEGINAPLTYTNWAPGEPNMGAGNEDSIVLWLTNSGGIQWNDARSDKEFPFLCEKSCTPP